MRKRTLLALVSFVVATPAVASAQIVLPGCEVPTRAFSSPFVLASINGACVDFSQFVAPSTSGKGWTLNAPLPSSVGQLASGQVTATFNPDPFITFGATTTNLIPGTVTYAFLFGTPIVPGTYTSASSSVGVSFTNGAGPSSMVSSPGVYPTYLSGYGTVGAVPTNLGVDLGTAPCVATDGNTSTCNYGTATSTFPPTFYDNLEALLTYRQDGLASVASWSGRVDLFTTVVPEPATVLLFASGLTMVGFVVRRQAMG